MLMLASCGSDDEAGVPNMLTELCDVYIDGNGKAVTATLDDGTVLDISAQQIGAEAADTTLRSVITYAMNGGVARVYSNSAVFCDEALPIESFTIAPRDPVKLVSIWQAGKYVNMVIGEMTTGSAPHPYGFCIDGLAGNKLYVSLLHQQPSGDAESYTRRVYASLRLSNSYVTGYDSVVVSVNTYDGVLTYSFSRGSN